MMGQAQLPQWTHILLLQSRTGHAGCCSASTTAIAINFSQREVEELDMFAMTGLQASALNQW